MANSPATRMQTTCDRFNAMFKIGDEIGFWTGPREGEPKTGKIRFEAQVMGGHTPVVYINGAGAIALTHIREFAS